MLNDKLPCTCIHISSLPRSPFAFWGITLAHARIKPSKISIKTICCRQTHPQTHSYSQTTICTNNENNKWAKALRDYIHTQCAPNLHTSSFVRLSKMSEIIIIIIITIITLRGCAVCVSLRRKAAFEYVECGT